MWVEIILNIMFIIFGEIVYNLLCSYMAEKKYLKKKWLLPKAYNEAIDNATKDNFVLMLNQDIWCSVIAGITVFGFLLVIGIVSCIIYYIDDKSLINFIIMSIVYILCSTPFLFIFIRLLSKKIFVTKETITVKTLFSTKK